MNKYKRNIVIAVGLLTCSLILIVITLTQSGRFMLADLFGYIGLLLVGAYFFVTNYRKYKKNNTNN